MFDFKFNKKTFDFFIYFYFERNVYLYIVSCNKSFFCLKTAFRSSESVDVTFNAQAQTG